MINPTVDRRVIETSNIHLEWIETPWDSALFGFPALQICCIEVRDSAAEADFAEFETYRDHVKCGFVSCRLPHERLKESMLLEARGFCFIEMVYYPEFDNLQTRELGAIPSELKVSIASSLDLPILEDIAGRVFRNERFYMDPYLDPNISDQRYRNWVISSFDHITQKLYCIHIGQQIVAFFVTEMLPNGKCYWHLNAVAPDAQSKGYGLSAWRAMMHQAREAGANGIRTCITARNHRVLNLYSRLGFRFSPPEMTFHWVKGRAID